VRIVLSLVVAVLASAPARAIVGGAEGGPGEASAVMVLGEGGAICTGVVASPRALITAAHCVPAGRGVRVFFREGGQPVLIEPAEVRRHPGFSADAVRQRTPSVDLALVRLDAALPARFRPAELTEATPQPQEPVTAAGFGLSREGDAATAGPWRSVSLSAVEPYGPSRLLIWARGQPGGGACQGDSGGPVFREGGAVTGVVSWSTGERGRRCGALTQAIRLGPQRGWIDATLASWGETPRWR
jgi:hypothetical protein